MIESSCTKIEIIYVMYAISVILGFGIHFLNLFGDYNAKHLTVLVRISEFLVKQILEYR